MIESCRKLVESRFFHNFIIVMILLAAVLVGMETYPELRTRFGAELEFLNRFVLWIFVLEAALKMLRHGRQFYRYFLDPWNAPYWVRDHCGEDRRRAWLYSTGPNRRRDSTRTEILGDDLAVRLR